MFLSIRWGKVVEVFGDSAGVEKLLYPVFVGLNERLAARRLKGFAEIEVESYHVIQIH